MKGKYELDFEKHVEFTGFGQGSSTMYEFQSICADADKEVLRLERENAKLRAENKELISWNEYLWQLALLDYGMQISTLRTKLARVQEHIVEIEQESSNFHQAVHKALTGPAYPPGLYSLGKIAWLKERIRQLERAEPATAIAQEIKAFSALDAGEGKEG